MGRTGQRIRALFLAATVVAGLGSAAPAFASEPDGCAGWQVETLASGLEQVENLEPDGQDGFYLSGDTKVYHVDGSGQVRTVMENLAAPGGLQLHGTNLYILTRQDGKLWRLDTVTGEFTWLADFPGNGLLRLPDGNFLTTWVGTEGGPSRGVSHYNSDTGVVTANWAPVPRGEGLALSSDHRTVYTDDLFTGQVYRIPLDTPDRWSVVTTVPGLLPGLDDLATSGDGDIYVAAHFLGAVHRVDPDSGATCAVTTGLPVGWAGPSSVRIEADGDRFALFVTAFDGTVRRVRPPADVELTPVQRA
ncbi:SMP-30/gluconolactonase/LRE family protein [Nocardia carnea]|uniref:SMP-30/gluconolactonase/LRE family protein n=1 Tax=Nocardia carnea TaxID=37328 RepID=UPI0024556141|nr:SMP-30/gluconolactonase/LRE family protein [Nocardia carnea]